ncbi:MULTISPECIES: XdhC family protein [Actibacterium]|uniref:Xanthine dehydrogenase accessory factor n=1 Tax=Actibacterium naphthalenivorans TaxID=1614693 RepID=A0A840CLA9_9RHOB|nr:MULTISPECIES: XdhC family protein [Actibacterium]MBB4023949.1 xanthine dehydrogenase accessory factor [Actibacterium naphthalenivorans]
MAPHVYQSRLEEPPIRALLEDPENGVLAIVSGVEGASYRPVGAMMAIRADGTRTGSLSSGCIEADMTHHAMSVLRSGNTRTLCYGAGSPFVDLRLPCGGGLEITLIPRPEATVLQTLLKRNHDRIPCNLRIDLLSGEMALTSDRAAPGPEKGFYLRLLPELRFLVFGKGPEASAFAALVHSLGYPSLLLSPDTETLENGKAIGAPIRHLTRRAFPDDLQVDNWTAIVLFFHDHDWEPPILLHALRAGALYVGAQGSRRAQATRQTALKELGVDEAEITRLHGPVGLVPSAKDARTLAVSVLAEVLKVAMETPS